MFSILLSSFSTSKKAISAANFLGNLYTPVLMLGNAMVLNPFSTAKLIAFL